MRSILKPMLELLAGIPTIVYGYFALTFFTPLLRDAGIEVDIFNVFSAGLIMGVMILPTVASLAEDAMSAVPRDLRDGAFALGATRREVATRIVVPAAVSGITAAFVLGISRAVGETMIVLVAAGQQPNLTFDPRAGCRDDVRVHRGDRGGRRADRIGRVQDDLRGRCDVVRDDADPERDLDQARGALPGGVRVTTVSLKRRGRDIKGAAFKGVLLLSLIVGFVTLVTLLVDVVRKGWQYVDKTLFTNPPSIDPAIAGARPAILATIYLGLMVIVFTVPIGVGTAIYLEEYADRKRWYNRLLELNIQNLAAVPSIVYGILGLAFVVRGLGLGQVLLAGALILTLLVLPNMIIASREALRAVPDTIRQGGYALGATQWQVTSRQVLPAALPGIATGSILVGLARHRRDRAADHGRRGDLRRVRPDGPRAVHGAADPDLPVGAAPAGRVPLARGRRDHRAARHLADLNAVAIWLRNRYQRRW